MCCFAVEALVGAMANLWHSLGCDEYSFLGDSWVVCTLYVNALYCKSYSLYPEENIVVNGFIYIYVFRITLLAMTNKNMMFLFLLRAKVFLILLQTKKMEKTKASMAFDCINVQNLYWPIFIISLSFSQKVL